MLLLLLQASSPAVSIDSAVSLRHCSTITPFLRTVFVSNPITNACFILQCHHLSAIIIVLQRQKCRTAMRSDIVGVAASLEAPPTAPSVVEIALCDEPSKEPR